MGMLVQSNVWVLLCVRGAVKCKGCHGVWLVRVVVGQLVAGPS